MTSVAGVDENNGQVGRGGSCHHVARVLLVARRVGDDEFAFGGGKIAVGHVDGNALFSFGRKAVGDQGAKSMSSPPFFSVKVWRMASNWSSKTPFESKRSLPMRVGLRRRPLSPRC